MRRPGALFCLALCGGCFHDLDRVLGDTAPALDQPRLDAEIRDGPTDLPSPSALCHDPALLMHLAFDEDPFDTADPQNPEPPLSTSPVVYYDASDGKPAPALRREGDDIAFSYDPDPNFSLAQGTVAVWVKPSVDLASFGDDKSRAIFRTTFKPGLIQLIHRSATDAEGRGIGVEVFGEYDLQQYSMFRLLADEGIAPAGKWVHLAATHFEKTKQITLYVNGAWVANGPADQPGQWPGSIPAGVLVGGGGDAPPTPNDPYRALPGLMDEVLVFNRALGPAEIKDLYLRGCRD